MTSLPCDSSDRIDRDLELDAVPDGANRIHNTFDALRLTFDDSRIAFDYPGFAFDHSWLAFNDPWFGLSVALRGRIDARHGRGSFGDHSLRARLSDDRARLLENGAGLLAEQ